MQAFRARIKKCISTKPKWNDVFCKPRCDGFMTKG